MKNRNLYCIILQHLHSSREYAGNYPGEVSILLDKNIATIHAFALQLHFFTYFGRHPADPPITW